VDNVHFSHFFAMSDILREIISEPFPASFFAMVGYFEKHTLSETPYSYRAISKGHHFPRNQTGQGSNLIHKKLISKKDRMEKMLKNPASLTKNFEKKIEMHFFH
jgi:hypothetical protein